MGLWRKEIASEAKKQLWLAGPMIAVSLFMYSLQLTSLMFAGHLGELTLSGASMATSFLNATGFMVLMGMASALDTFCGQSYGAEQYHMLGIHMQRGMLVILLVAVAQSIILANLRPILVALHQDHNIAKEAGVYARYMIPSLFAYGLLQCNIKFLQNQNIVFPMVLTTGISSLIHVLFCWVLVLKAELGIKGAAIAFCISNWISLLLLALYIKYSSSCKRTWTGFSRESFHNIPQFFRLALPSALMICLEAWTFELMVILSGTFPNPKLQTSVSSICLNTSGLLWMLPFGIAAAASTRISNELGAGYPKAAKLALEVTLSMALIVGVLEFSLLMILRNIWGGAFTNVHEVVRYVASMLPVVASAAFMDSIQTVLSGVARGCGWQKLGAFVNLGSYYLVGVPLAVVFAIVLHMKVKGLWMGIALALVVQVVCLLLITMRTNWEKEAKNAAIRVQGPRVPASNLNATN
ncbi:protein DETOXIFICATION 16-like [Prosopis cineraria]|uniref:protein DETOXIFICATION 16-like n=1 Tax=Prosopis cineraria TaxID=364024 RepID=UPI002410AB16|nr:protein DETOXIFICATION 16-like [Prosopis cineraria]